jgi:hypothetical protein
MYPTRIEGTTHEFGQPADWDAEKHGECMTLAVRLTDDGCCESAWRPTEDEIRALLKGAPLILRVYGGQPAVMLTVEDVSYSRVEIELKGDYFSREQVLALIEQIDLAGCGPDQKS